MKFKFSKVANVTGVLEFHILVKMSRLGILKIHLTVNFILNQVLAVENAFLKIFNLYFITFSPQKNSI